MSKPIITVDNLSKRYRIGAAEKGYKTFREAITDWITAPVKNLAKLQRLTKFKNNPSLSDEEDVIWALKDVSFEVKQGEVVGIIGLNGAGKTTLLKILSRITEPTIGDVQLYGRVSSLLEVGTGFHPELTGRENIYLNGAILGMRKAEIDSKFDEIVAFAEIEKFLDTPVKRYSSGMYVRLAFAVAAHLEPEILIVDEVLAVGDMAFQKKCLGKMRNVAKSGHTVIFVSHNMGAVSHLCQRGVVLKKGKLDYLGTTAEAIKHYMQTPMNNAGIWELGDTNVESADGAVAKFTRIQLEDEKGVVKDSYFIGETMRVHMEVIFYSQVRQLKLSFMIKSPGKGPVYHCVSSDAPFAPTNLYGLVTFTATFPKLNLYPGTYVIDLLHMATMHGETLDCIRDLLVFHINEGGPCVFRELAQHAAVIHEVPEWSVSESKELD